MRAREKAIRLLVARNDIDSNTKNHDGNTPLLLAANGQIEVYSKSGQYETVVRPLLKRSDIDIYATNNDGDTAISLATKNGKHLILGMLQERMAICAQTESLRDVEVRHCYAVSGSQDAVEDYPMCTRDCKAYDNFCLCIFDEGLFSSYLPL